MSLTTIVTQFVLTVGASLAERLASALTARIKQEPEPEANPVDIAIATKSAVSADREGKIASEIAGRARVCRGCGVFGGPKMGRCPLCNTHTDSVRRLGDYGPSGGG